tara:strand:+ start:2402 stop:5449 length:3048 start_codon:yes stop_codon:yes gene_type:complete
MDAKKVLLIGWDAADWRVIHPLVDQGKMPAMEHFINHGVIGDLATLQPVLSPMLWTSIATGKRPYKHGVHGFTEPDPVTGGIRPVTNLSRNTKAIWNILNQQGLKSNVVGWWPSNPAEPINGVMVSNDYQRAGANTTADNWPMKPGTVHPERLEETLKALRRHPTTLSNGDIAFFLPEVLQLSKKEVEKVNDDPRLQSLCSIIGDTFTIHEAAQHLFDHEPWDFMAVYYDAIDHFGHGFMKYHPPKRPWISDEDFRLYQHVIEAGYRLHDNILGMFLEKIDPVNTTVLLISDHGFHPDHLRPWTLPKEPAGPAAEHRDFGIFGAYGPGLKQDALISGASLLDVCPTILNLFDLPVGEDMDGRPLTELHSVEPEVRWIPSWDEVHEGNPGTHSPDKQIAPTDSKASIDQLVALGYIEKPAEDMAQAIEETVRELNYNLAGAHIDGGNYREAADLLQGLYERWPEEHRFGIKLATCYRALRKLDELGELIEGLLQRRIEEAETAKEGLQRLRRKMLLDRYRLVRRKLFSGNRREAKLNRRRLGRRKMVRGPFVELRVQRRQQMQRKVAMKQRRRQGELRELNARAFPNLFSLQHLAAWADLANRKPREALEKLREADEEHAHRPELHNLRGQIYLGLGDTESARESFAEADKHDPGNPQAKMGLCRCALREKIHDAAIEHALASLAKNYDQPWGHQLLGLAYFRSGRYDEAEQAFLTAASQSTCFPAPWRMLSQLYKFVRKDIARAAEFHREALKARAEIRDYLEAKFGANAEGGKDLQSVSQSGGSESGLQIHSTPPRTTFTTDVSVLDGVPDSEMITIVSGLPRSGTSMLMQMLDAGGIPALTDARRKADESNPRGYYEYEPATQLQRNRNWVPEAKGKAVKVVAQLLPFLPSTDENGEKLHYRVLFLDRDLNEILASQHKMLEREQRLDHGGQGDLASAFRHQLAKVREVLNEREIPALEVQYAATVSNPAEAASILNRFLGNELNKVAMEETVDRNLYRNVMAPCSGTIGVNL